MIQPQGGKRRPSGSEIIAGILILILAVITIVSAVTVYQLPEAVTEQGRRTNNLYEATLVISFIVFFLVTAAIIWAVFRYRRRSNDEMPEQVHGSSVLASSVKGRLVEASPSRRKSTIAIVPITSAIAKT